MSIKKQHLIVNSAILKDKVNRYAILGLLISFVTIALASVLVSYFMTKHVSFAGIILAHKTNPALWGLDLTPFMFAYWGQSFCYEIANTMEDMLEHTTRTLNAKSTDLEFKLEYANNHDYLTHLPNQKLLLQRIHYNLKNLNKGENLVLIIISLNQFKELQATSGSFHANSLLVQFAEILKTILLEPYLLQAYMGMNMVARLDGENFAFLLPRIRKSHDLEKIIQNIIDDTKTNLMIDGQKIHITTTIGLAISPINTDNPESLINYASIALNFARKNKKSYAAYKSDMLIKEKSSPNIKIEELTQAIASNSLEILYTPELILKNGKIIGVELSARFIDNEGMITHIDKFIHLIQGSDYIKKLTDLLLYNAISQLSIWHKAGHKLYARVHLYDLYDKDLPQKIKKLLTQFKIDAQFLKLAVTERACLIEQHKTSAILEELSKMNLSIAISDFCSGYAVFTYLTYMPVNELKLDESFIKNITEPKKYLLLKAIMSIATNLDLKLYAQGIINQEMLKILEELGYKYGQGEYFASSLSAEEISRRLNLA